jgi:hypothetical protein
MDLRIRALGRTAGLIAIWTLVPLGAVRLLEFINLDAEKISLIGAAGLLAVFTWLVYSIVLGQLQWEEACKNSSDRVVELQKKLSK